MNVTLYKYFGNLKQLHKNLTPYVEDEDKKTLTNVYLKDGSSVTHPSLLITSSDDLSEFNYCYIPVWNRYYFMEVDSICNTLWEFKCSVDVLFSNATAIDSNYGYIERSESLGNDLIVDDADTFENVNSITITNLSGETQGNLKTIDITENINNGTNISISVINDLNVQTFDEDDTIFELNLVPPITSMTSVKTSDNIGMNYYNYIYVADLVKINTCLKKIYSETDATFIKSVICWPFKLDTLKEKDANGALTNNPQEYTMRLGSNNYGSNNVYRLKYGSLGFLTFFDYTFPSVSNYYDYDPFTTYELFIPYVGWKTINIKDVEGSRILLTFRCNFESGKCTIYLLNYTKDYIIASYDAQIGCLVPLSRSNLEELNAQAISNAISMVIGVIGGAVSTTIGVASKNPVAIAGGIMSASSSIAKGVSNNVGMFEKGQVQVRDGNSGCDSRNVILKKTTRIKVSSPSAQMGKPVKKVDLISNCSGFTQAKINKLNGLEYASKWEQDEIIRLFQEGIII